MMYGLIGGLSGGIGSLLVLHVVFSVPAQSQNRMMADKLAEAAPVSTSSTFDAMEQSHKEMANRMADAIVGGLKND
ncbi:hypothetical protein AD951_02675 [Acetobacter malorum]|uniref:Uncharacterized protein n=2 Tax=Acetobacter malorum TaxID=178901 RepID=A0A149URB5_9PROT|nr:hypothetical protein AD951_02675 [Acetobacter malorum]